MVIVIKLFIKQDKIKCTDFYRTDFKKIGSIGKNIKSVKIWLEDEKNKKIGRNEPCFCGSGKKFKHCHGAL